MIKNTHILAILLIFLSGCAALDYQEIIRLDSKDFDSLQLNPEIEPNGLRIDLIRKNRYVYYIDSLEYTELVPYHPLGFDLGNGIFYDLSGNLSLRVDHLLNFSCDSSFEIATTIKRTSRTNFRFYDDSLSYYHPPKTKIRQQYHRVVHGDSMFFHVKKERDFTVVKTESDLLFMGKKRIWNGIHYVDEGKYALYRRNKKTEFSLNENEIILNRDLRIRMTPDRKKIQVYKYKRKLYEPMLLLTIERSKDKIFVYNKRNAGLKIEINGKSMEVSNGKKMLNRFELLANKRRNS